MIYDFQEILYQVYVTGTSLTIVLILMVIVLFLYLKIERQPITVAFAILSLLIPLIVGYFADPTIGFFIAATIVLLTLLGFGPMSEAHVDWTFKNVLKVIGYMVCLGIGFSLYFLILRLTFPIWTVLIMPLIVIGLVLIVVVFAMLILGGIFVIFTAPYELWKKYRQKIIRRRINKKINKRAYSKGLDETGHKQSLVGAD